MWVKKVLFCKSCWLCDFKAHTCSYQDAPLACLELVERSNALGLSHLAMNGDSIKAQVAQHESHLARVVTSACEDHECCAC